MLQDRKYHAIIIIGVWGVLLPLGYDLLTSIGVSLGFGASFSLLRWNWKNFRNYC